MRALQLLGDREIAFESFWFAGKNVCPARRAEIGFQEAWTSPEMGLARLLPTNDGKLDADAQDHHYLRPEGAMVVHRNLLGTPVGPIPGRRPHFCAMMINKRLPKQWP
jgi:hypothetical protein